MNQLSPNLPVAIAHAIKRLLSSKHLYQSLKITVKEDFGDASADQVLDVEVKLHHAEISFTGSQAIRVEGEAIQISVPNIKTYCTKCGDREPFASLSAVPSPCAQPASAFGEIPQVSQILHLKFKCQSCQTEQVDFLIARKANKLTIVGRWPFEESPAPLFIPKELREHYSKAVITFNAGFLLAAILYLRVLIEQFWRSRNSVLQSQRATGDELGTSYNETLPDDFKTRFPSLLDIYNQISGALHTANADASLFEDSLEKLHKHFEALKLFEL